MARFEVHQLYREDIYKDIIRVNEAHRINKHGDRIKEGQVCRVWVNGRKCLAVLRGHQDSDSLQIRMDDYTRRKLDLRENSFYEFEFKQAGFFGQLCWAWNATEIGYQVASRIAVLGFFIGVVALIPAIVELLPWRDNLHHGKAFDLAQAMPPCNPLLYGWELNVSRLEYVLLCLLLALVIRVAHSLVRALAIVKGDYPGSKVQNIPKDWRTGFWWCLNGFNDHKEHRDLWIPTVLGFLELSIYPILLSLQYYAVIGAWVGIKTAGSWMGYSKSRTSFNRFLLFTVLSLLLACVLMLFIDRVKCV